MILYLTTTRSKGDSANKNKQKNTNKRVQYSKIITFLTFILFCGCIIRCFFVDITTAYDLSLYATIITTSGMLSLTSIVWYLKNSQAEKVARIKAETYRIISEERYKYNKKMLELKSKYKYTDEEVFEIESNSPLDELEQDALDSMNSSIDSAMEEAAEPIEAQTL